MNLTHAAFVNASGMLLLDSNYTGPQPVKPTIPTFYTVVRLYENDLLIACLVSTSNPGNTSSFVLSVTPLTGSIPSDVTVQFTATSTSYTDSLCSESTFELKRRCTVSNVVHTYEGSITIFLNFLTSDALAATAYLEVSYQRPPSLTIQGSKFTEDGKGCLKVALNNGDFSGDNYVNMIVTKNKLPFAYLDTTPLVNAYIVYDGVIVPQGTSSAASGIVPGGDVYEITATVQTNYGTSLDAIRMNYDTLPNKPSNVSIELHQEAEFGDIYLSINVTSINDTWTNEHHVVFAHIGTSTFVKTIKTGDTVTRKNSYMGQGWVKVTGSPSVMSMFANRDAAGSVDQPDFSKPVQLDAYSAACKFGAEYHAFSDAYTTSEVQLPHVNFEPIVAYTPTYKAGVDMNAVQANSQYPNTIWVNLARTGDMANELVVPVDYFTMTGCAPYSTSVLSEGTTLSSATTVTHFSGWYGLLKLPTSLAQNIVITHFFTSWKLTWTGSVSTLDTTRSFIVIKKVLNVRPINELPPADLSILAAYSNLTSNSLPTTLTLTLNPLNVVIASGSELTLQYGDAHTDTGARVNSFANGVTEVTVTGSWPSFSSDAHKFRLVRKLETSAGSASYYINTTDFTVSWNPPPSVTAINFAITPILSPTTFTVDLSNYTVVGDLYGRIVHGSGTIDLGKITTSVTTINPPIPSGPCTWYLIPVNDNWPIATTLPTALTGSALVFTITVVKKQLSKTENRLGTVDVTLDVIPNDVSATFNTETPTISGSNSDYTLTLTTPSIAENVLQLVCTESNVSGVATIIVPWTPAPTLITLPDVFVSSLTTDFITLHHSSITATLNAADSGLMYAVTIKPIDGSSVEWVIETNSIVDPLSTTELNLPGPVLVNGAREFTDVTVTLQVYSKTWSFEDMNGCVYAMAVDGDDQINNKLRITYARSDPTFTATATLESDLTYTVNVDIANSYINNTRFEIVTANLNVEYFNQTWVSLPPLNATEMRILNVQPGTLLFHITYRTTVWSIKTVKADDGVHDVLVRINNHWINGENPDEDTSNPENEFKPRVPMTVFCGGPIITQPNLIFMNGNQLNTLTLYRPSETGITSLLSATYPGGGDDMSDVVTVTNDLQTITIDPSKPYVCIVDSDVGNAFIVHSLELMSFMPELVTAVALSVTSTNNTLQFNSVNAAMGVSYVLSRGNLVINIIVPVTTNDTESTVTTLTFEFSKETYQIPSICSSVHSIKLGSSVQTHWLFHFETSSPVQQTNNKFTVTMPETDARAMGIWPFRIDMGPGMIYQNQIVNIKNVLT